MPADKQPAKLQLVPATAPTPVERIRQRLKAVPRPDGMLQCNRCGGQSMLTERAGVIIKNGRRNRGTVIVKDVCAACWREGIIVPMLPALKEID
jgi:hypothetical protein